MNALDRRSALQVGAGLAGLALTSGTAFAAAPLAGTQAPGFYRFMVGDLEITLVNDGQATFPLGEGFVTNQPLETVQAELASNFQPTDTLTIPFTTVVVNDGERLVMIDSGTGGNLAPTAGTWMRNFNAAGYTADQVDLIVVSHFHPDHIEGIRHADGTLNFPNAAVMVPEVEWGFWMDEGQMSRAPEAMQARFQGVRRIFEPMQAEVMMYGDKATPAAGITAVAAHGHTPGHMTFLVESGGESLLVWSDTTNKPELFVANPNWHARFDMDAEAAAQTRIRLLDMAAAEGMQVAGYHFPFPATGFIASENGGYSFHPAFWQSAP